MSIQKVPTEVNAFVKGLITEASPLTFPENASLDEANFLLNRDGSRQRRLGMDLQGASRILSYTGLGDKAASTFLWKDVAGIADKSFIVCQIGTVLLFYSTIVGQDFPEYHSEIDMSSTILFETENIQQVDMVSVGGVLVVASGSAELFSVEYKEATDSFEADTYRLKVRDQFGIQDPYVRGDITLSGGTVIPAKNFDDLLTDQESQIRPYSMTAAHTYNLRNQSWGRLRDGLIQSTEEEGLELSKDPIDIFREATFKKSPFLYVGTGLDVFPSNSDLVATGLINYAEKKGAPERFSAQELGETPRAASSAPKGYFIIDALNRGFSRQENVLSMLSEGAGQYVYGYFDPYPTDLTPKGAGCVEEFAGRMWYSGFSNEVIGGDKRSPKLGSYVLFSQLVKDSSELANCYQKNDPTYEKEADLLATDGGVIRLDGAYGIKKFANIGDSLIVLATNGVWAISGGSDEGFTAESYIVRKISDQGILAPKSVVTVNNSCMFWGEDGIYVVSQSEVGGYNSQNISNNTIQKRYESIPLSQRRAAYGIYDKYENTARWVYGEKAVGNPSYELVLNLDLNAYSVNVIKAVSTTSPIILAPVTVPLFKAGTAPLEVVVGGVQVLAGLDEVLINEKSSEAGSRETYYFSLTSENRVAVGFSTYADEQFLDWKTSDGVGIDAEAFLITGYGPQGDFQRRKQASRITTYMTKTEDGFEADGADLVPANQSGCLLQARWDWHNSPAGNRWGRENQIYKNKRLYMPDSISDIYDDGESVISTKTKLRGHGKTLSLLFKSEPLKDCRILGWSMVTDVSTNV